MKHITTILSLIFVCQMTRASTFFMPDSDTAALVMLVSNTASTVTNTLKILEVAKETSQKMDEYNFLAMRRYFIARRIEQHARDVVATSEMEPKSLQELNFALFNLKSNLKGLKSNLDFLGKDVYEAQNYVDSYWSKIINAREDELESHRQELSSANEGSSSKHIQNTAMNTAMTSKILSKLRKDNLEYQKIDLGIKKSNSIEDLRREEHYKNWIGLKSANSKLEGQAE